MKQYTPEMAIQNARLDLITNLPFYGSVFLRLNTFEDTNCPTAWTDGISLGYNPAYLGKLPHKMIIGVFVHEVLHIINKHHLRAAADPEKILNPKVWNYAADYAINPVIHRSPGMDISPDWLYESKWDDELAEFIFQELKRDLPKVNACDASGDGPGEVRPYPGKDKDGKAKPAGSKPTKAEIDQASNEVDQMVKTAAFKAQGAGKFSNDQRRVLKQASATTVDWTEELQFLAETITKDDYTWKRPATSYRHLGIYLPSMHGTSSVDMIFYIDKSGSLSEEMLRQIMGEVRAIIEHFNIRVICVYWDTKFCGIEIFDADDVVDPAWEINVGAGGGTNFDDCWKWLDANLDEHDIDPEAMVFFSDLECSNYPKDDPGMPLIWAQVPSYGNNFQTTYISYLPDYGKHVKVPIYGD